jgi:hypothetical protein
VRLHEANVLEFETLPSFWMDYDLIVSAAMLEYVPRFELLGALKALRTRLARHGWIVVFITRPSLRQRISDLMEVYTNSL